MWGGTITPVRHQHGKLEPDAKWWYAREKQILEIRWLLRNCHVRFVTEQSASLGRVLPSWCTRSVSCACLVTSEVFFKIKFIYFWGILIPQMYFLIIKWNIFRGDLSDISAKTATLLVTVDTMHGYSLSMMAHHRHPRPGYSLSTMTYPRHPRHGYSLSTMTYPRHPRPGHSLHTMTYPRHPRHGYSLSAMTYSRHQTTKYPTFPKHAVNIPFCMTTKHSNNHVFHQNFRQDSEQ